MASTIKVDQIEGSTGSTITVPTGQTLTLTDGLAVASLPTVTVAKGGTGIAGGFTAGDVLYATGSTTLAKLPKGTAEQILSMNTGATAPEWTTVDVSVGGTGQTSFTNGDILYATGATTLTKLAKGSAADVLTMNAGATAPEWAASAGGGKLLQVVSSTDEASSTVTTGTNTGGWGSYGLFHDATITPTLNTSKVLVLWHLMWGFESGFHMHLGRDDANGDVEIWLADASGTYRNRALTGAHNYEQNTIQRYSGSYLDSPALASAVTYEFKVSSNSASSFYKNRSLGDRDHSLGYDGHGVSGVTLMEIGV